MNWFIHPEFLWLAPLVAAPIIIHLLNRIRYRRVRWAAMEFLLTTERRAVRRARIQQWLLMAMRILLLAFALLALAQPVLRGPIAAVLGGSGQVAVLLDSSASMQAQGPTGTAFAKAAHTAKKAVEGLPSGTRAMAGAAAQQFETPFATPILSRSEVLREIDETVQTDGASNIPQSIMQAAERMQASGGGAIWVLTDMQRNAWRTDDVGLWEKVKAAVEAAGQPKILVTDVSSPVESNLSIEDVTLSAQTPQVGGTVELEVTVKRQGSAEDVIVELYLNGQREGRSEVQSFFDAESIRIPLALRNLRKGPNWGHVSVVGVDKFPADNRYNFVVTTEAHLPVLVVEGTMDSGFFIGPALSGRSPFAVENRPYAALQADEALDRFVAIVLTDVPRLEDDVVAALKDYVAGGGLVVFFPGANTELNPWNTSGLLPATMNGVVTAAEQERPRPDEDVAGVERMTVGLDQITLRKLYALEAATDARTLAQTAEGRPFLVRRRDGTGTVYTFAVSAGQDFSNLPMRPVFLIMLRRMLMDHLSEIGQPLSYPALSTLRLQLPGAATEIIDPEDHHHKLDPVDDLRKPRPFAATAHAGIYRMDVPLGMEDGGIVAAEGEQPELTPVAAVNVPTEEASIEKLDDSDIAAIEGILERGIIVTDPSGLSESSERPGGAGGESAFPFAVLALLMIAGEAAMAWYISRPTATSGQDEQD